MSAAHALHVLAAVLWVGGMFFAYMILRPSAGPLEPPDRLSLWARVFQRFFGWVWGSILVLLVSGYGMIHLEFGGFAHLPIYINVMQGLGWIMVLMFLHLFFAPWKRFRRLVAAGDFPAAKDQLEQIRMIVKINLGIGLVVVLVAGSGRYW